MENIIFEYADSDFTYQSASWADQTAPQLSKFDQRLAQRWDKSMKDGAFRYTVDHTISRVIPGPKKYVCHLNTLRATERRKAQVITSVKQPTNPQAFNFTKVQENEIVFHMKNEMSDPDNNTVSNGDASECAISSQNNGHQCCSGREKESVHTLLINNSPLDHGHCLLAPDRNLCLPQVMTQRGAAAAIEIMLLSQHRGFCMGFNSMCAFASVNHLHLHCFYLDHEIMVNNCPVHHLAGKYSEFTALPIPAFALQLHGSTVEELSRMIHGITSYLHESDIAHNLFLCRGAVFGEERTSSLTTIRAFIWPRKKYIGDPTEEVFNLACIELGGYLAFKDPDAYHNYNEEDVDAHFRDTCLPPAEYEPIKSHIVKLGQGQSKTP